MWETHYEAETTAPPKAVWAALRALHSGTPLGPESDSFELHGPFAAGTRVTVTPRGQEAMESVILDVREEESYADRTLFGDLALTFRHDLEPLPGGGTTVRHTLTIDGAGSDEVGPQLGPQISADFPVAMAELFAAAERDGSSGRDA